MPELPVKEGRLSDLRLPEISRDDIVRSLSEIRLPDVDLSKIERPKVDMPNIDVGKALAGAAAAAHIGRQARRPRWPFALGGVIVVGLATAAVLSNEMVRDRIASGIAAARKRWDAMFPSGDDSLDIDFDRPVAFDAADTVEIQPGPFAEGVSTMDVSGYPAGLGSDNGESSREQEEAGRPS